MAEAHEPRRLALDLTFQPGDYLCTWHVPDEADRLVDVPGRLSVSPNRAPEGEVYGDLPIHWELQPGVQSAAFPQSRRLETLSGRLASGAYVLMTDVEITYWATRRGQILGSFAVLSHSAPAEPLLRYRAVRFQVQGLDAIAGLAPLKEVKWPSNEERQGSKVEWKVVANPHSSLDWSDSGAQLSLDFDGIFSPFDPYAFRIGFSPVVRIEVTEPLTLQQWMVKWIEPIRRVVSIALGRRQELTYVATSSYAGGEGQVFGATISQQTYEASYSSIRLSRPPLLLYVDRLSLLALARRWQELEREHHPLIETYGAMLTSGDSHPRSKFLLLIQALEGLHGYNSKDEYQRRTNNHHLQRDKVLESIRKSDLDKNLKKFIRKHLRKDPPTSLESVLAATIPSRVVKRLDETQLVAEVKRELSERTTAFEALRRVRNQLSHGNRGYDAYALAEVAQVLEQVVRRHALYELGCSATVADRVFQMM